MYAGGGTAFGNFLMFFTVTPLFLGSTFGPKANQL